MCLCVSLCASLSLSLTRCLWSTWLTYNELGYSFHLFFSFSCTMPPGHCHRNIKCNSKFTFPTAIRLHPTRSMENMSIFTILLLLSLALCLSLSLSPHPVMRDTALSHLTNLLLTWIIASLLSHRHPCHVYPRFTNTFRIHRLPFIGVHSLPLNSVSLVHRERDRDTYTWSNHSQSHRDSDGQCTYCVSTVSLLIKVCKS